MRRREFNKLLGQAALAGCAAPLASFRVLAGELRADNGPRLPAGFDEVDHYQLTHKLRDGWDFTAPAPSLHKEVVIVGGGLSGLTTAYRMPERDWSPRAGVDLVVYGRSLTGTSRSARMPPVR